MISADGTPVTVCHGDPPDPNLRSQPCPDGHRDAGARSRRGLACGRSRSWCWAEWSVSQSIPPVESSPYIKSGATRVSDKLEVKTIFICSIHTAQFQCWADPQCTIARMILRREQSFCAAVTNISMAKISQQEEKMGIQTPPKPPSLFSETRIRINHCTNQLSHH